MRRTLDGRTIRPLDAVATNGFTVTDIRSAGEVRAGMLSAEENAALTRVGAHAPMGKLLRGYWQPILLSSELGEPDGAPVRVRALGEDLVAFRDSDARVGLLGANCPHRRISGAGESVRSTRLLGTADPG